VECYEKSNGHTTAFLTRRQFSGRIVWLTINSDRFWLKDNLLRTMLTLFSLVFASMIVSVIGLSIVQSIVPAEILKDNNDIAGNYLQTLGTIYAVLLAFVVFVVWSQYNDACKMVEYEADEFWDVLRFVRTLPAPDRARLLVAARDFIREQIENEWPLMARGKACHSAAKMLDAFWEMLSGYEPRSAREEALFSEAISRFNGMCDARTDLIHSSRIRLSPTMWTLILTGGCSTVMSMYLFWLKHFWGLALMTASLAGCVSFVLFVIYDLDNPFNGDWQVRPEPLRLILEQLKKDIVAASRLQQ